MPTPGPARRRRLYRPSRRPSRRNLEFQANAIIEPKIKNRMEPEQKMKKYFRAKSQYAAVPGRTKFTAALYTSAALGLALCIAASALHAAGISISGFRASESSATAAGQRKSGGHPQSSQSPSSDSGTTTQKGANVTQAKGTFEVKVEP